MLDGISLSADPATQIKLQKIDSVFNKNNALHTKTKRLPQNKSCE
jgi:hypothetical protein